MRDFLDYRHYIFDLYGTLIDIRTDEESPAFWRRVAAWYAAYGADWPPQALRVRYRAMVAEEEAALGCAYPEIRLETVFLRLLREAPETHAAAAAPVGPAAERTWLTATAAMFRGNSRTRLRRCPGAAALLAALRAREKHIWLLSNAQAVFTGPELEQCKLADCFDGICLSSDFGMKKPEPRFLGALMEAEGMDPADTLMIGNDWRSDMTVAAANGVAGLWVNSDRLTPQQRQAERRALLARFDAAEIGEIERLSALLYA